MKDIHNRNRLNSNKKVRGLALLEILIAIGILGIISAGVATLASRTFEEQNASLINKSVTDLSMSLKKAFSRAGQYSGDQDDFDALIAAGAISENSATNPITNAFYGYAPIAKYDGAVSGSAFVITINGLSKTLCKKIVTGPLVTDASYFAASLLSAPTAPAHFDVDADLESNGVIKTLRGLDSEANNPIAYEDVCEQGDNTILYGTY
ncbi:prepilin-type N-terminal cleavage/methylation domain-containing protein [Vibrio aestuarianus]|uniref:prepilin-type N-terminal cleavage/methylation domain-containing protein n=1 Tax=Vibrio aestuarianus TaxID=28171 RepID=UPI00237CEE07|nr:prepilin-type N-terminal cleavage/methylation domain-containing protein [Vibrio aestuarianus]MDE1334796.1 prepilin-type N-terminal cleavage/methylation domain-containing protein [Vibrio aestuarianus]